MRSDLQILADALTRAHRDRVRVDATAMPLPANDAEAYEVQDGVAANLGWFGAERVTAWKVGAASRDSMPNAAPLPPQRVRASPATFVAGTFGAIGIEGEIAFRLRSALSPVALARGPAAPNSALDAAIGELVVTMEIVDPRYANVEAAGPRLRLADQGLHGALVVGSGVPYRDGVDWTSLVARVIRDGEIVTQTRGGHPLGDLRFLLVWLAGHAAQRCTHSAARDAHAPTSRELQMGGLGAGDIVTLGTWTGLIAADPGQTIEVVFPTIGSASARFA